MKAIILKGVKDLVVEDIPIPEIDERNNVLVKVDMCGLCGTDVHMWAGTNLEGTFPFIPGHEFVGRVVQTGKNVKYLKVGDRVTGECFLGCRVCEVCRNGGKPNFCLNPYYYGFFPHTPGSLAEYNCSPEERLYKVPDTISDETAALTEPISVAYHAFWNRGGGVGPHDRVGIIGAGPIGIFATAISIISHPQVIVIEPQPYRVKMAREFGAELIIDPTKENAVDKVMELTTGRGLTHIIECSGSSSGIAMTVDIIGVDGKIILTGQSVGTKIPIELGKIIWKHASIIGSCGSALFTQKTLDFMGKNLVDFDKAVTHKFYIDDAVKAFELGNKGTESGKIMIYMNAAKKTG